MASWSTRLRRMAKTIATAAAAPLSRHREQVMQVLLGVERLLVSAASSRISTRRLARRPESTRACYRDVENDAVSRAAARPARNDPFVEPKGVTR